MKPQDLSRLLRRHRALGAGLLTALAVLTALPALTPASAAGVQVVVATRDLAPGEPLDEGDLTTRALPEEAVPDGALHAVRDAVGRSTVGRVRRSEPLTDARLLGSSLGTAAGLVATPVRLADPQTAALLHAGDRVDVLAAATSPEQSGSAAVTVAQGLQVLAVPAPDEGAEGGLVVLATTPATAARLAAAAVGSRLSVTLLPPA